MEEAGEQVLSKNQQKKLMKNKKQKMTPEEKAKLFGLDKEKKAKEEPKQKVSTFVNTTPKGEKKDMTIPIQSSYDPVSVECGWNDYWEMNGFYKANPNSEAHETFSLVIPPPNVTGSLHLGHALTIGIEDALVRYHRMKGKNVVWIPGIDHAGIATQVVVEKMLMRETGKTRHDLGREAFMSKVWEWKQKYGNNIQNQLKRLGASVDWSREVFTMDDKLTYAVNTAFIRMFNNKKIYRGYRLVNWSCSLKTAISDIEVETKELDSPISISVPGHPKNKKYDFGYLTYFIYPVFGYENEQRDKISDNMNNEDMHKYVNELIKTGKYLIVATTRLETMLGDTAVAVNSNDDRYKHLHGKFVYHPFRKVKIPIICDDELVDMSFGTGAVKITPSHDENDFNCGLRHNLERICILTDDGKISDNGGVFSGQMRYDARISIELEMRKTNLYIGREPNKMTLPFCSRSKDILEPMLKPQWYVSCKDMATKSYNAVQNKELKIIPEMFEPVWYRWMNPDTIKDWCISRQLWWGHRIPAYKLVHKDRSQCNSTEDEWCVGYNIENAYEDAKKKYNYPDGSYTLEQDDDVLDTWFSSGLFPFSTHGWPNESIDLSKYYPNTMLETGHDILFFWVARMVMMGLELTGKLPFHTVYLHPMIRDKYGKKMSKSSGNVIDPLEIIDGCPLEHLIEKLKDGNLDANEVNKHIALKQQEFPNGIRQCGNDALRFALLNYTLQGRDMNLDINRIVGYRNFCNKIWNACKFSLSNLQNVIFPNNIDQHIKTIYPQLSLYNRWILSRYNYAALQLNINIQKYDFYTCTTLLYNLWLYEICDVYLELIKPVLYIDLNSSKQQLDEKYQTQIILYYVVYHSLILLHPYMVFISQELYQRFNHLNGKTDDIITTHYPDGDESMIDSSAENKINLILETVHDARSIETLFSLSNNKNIKNNYYMYSSNNDINTLIDQEFINYTKILLKCNDIVTIEPVNTKFCNHVTKSLIIIRLLIDDTIDLTVIITKLQDDLNKTKDLHDKLFAITSSDGYIEKVPDSVREDNQTKLDSYTSRISLLEEALSTIKK